MTEWAVVGKKRGEKMEKVKHGVGRDKKTIVLEMVESHIDRLSDLARRIRDGGDARLSEDDKLNIRTCAVPQITHTLDMLKMSYRR